MRDMYEVMDRWGAWAASDNSGVDWQPIAAGFKGLLPHGKKSRIQCDDDEGIMIDSCVARLRRYKPEEYERLMEAYQSVRSDLKYFPIPSTEVDFENTYGALRDYGGLRVHEGCDLFGRKKESGYYPVLSVTDGVVENIGWLPLGGYRIGIRAPKGGYFYYAHLDTYEKDFQTGEEVSAGDILGYMGNTGYGTEGTRGMFPVHLHLGIYIRTPHYEELSVNPYWVLKAISKKIRNYSY